MPGSLWEQPPVDRTGLESPFTRLAARVVPAVVSVETQREFRHPRVRGGDRLRRMLGDDDEDPGDEEMEVPSTGSGFIFDAAGYVFTNDHVVAGSVRHSVTLHDGRVFEATLIGTDPLTDVAVLQINLPAGEEPLPTIPLGNSDAVRVGDWAIAVGNPLGELEATLTVGVVSAMGRRNLRIAGGGPVYQDFFQTDASINFGNSGGPLVNVRGEVMAINSAINPTGQGIGFAIPINMAREVGVELIRSGTVSRGYLGIRPADLSAGLRDELNLPEGSGIVVGSVSEDTPAEAGGLREGDVIITFNSVPVPDVPGFRTIVAEAAIGQEVPIVFLRRGRERETSVILVERPDTPEPPATWSRPEGWEDWLGATIVPIDAALGRRFQLAVEEGLVVTDVYPESPAAIGGLREGDVLLELNRELVKTTRFLAKEIERSRERGRTAVFLVQRGSTTTYVEVRTESGAP